LGLEIDATWVALAQQDVNCFLKTVAASGETAMAACDASVTELINRSMEVLALHLDAARVPTFFVPSDGKLQPLVTLSVHRGKKKQQ
jgi:hypothetical protein